MIARYDAWRALREDLVGSFYLSNGRVLNVKDVLGPGSDLSHLKILSNVFYINEGNFEENVVFPFSVFYSETSREDITREKIEMFKEAERERHSQIEKISSGVPCVPWMGNSRVVSQEDSEAEKE